MRENSEGDIFFEGLGIQAVAAHSRWGDLERTWEAWLSGGAGMGAMRPQRAGGPMEDLPAPSWQALTHRMLRELTRAPAAAGPDCGMILATTKGDLRGAVQWMRYADGVPGNPGDPAESCELPTLGGEAGRLGRAARADRPAYAVSGACASGLIGLIDAAIALLSGEAQRMLVIAADAADDFVGDGFRALRALSLTSCKPFDANRDGLALGPGAAGCMLGLGDSAMVGVLSGWGISNDATHMTAPDPGGAGLARAIRQALAMAGLVPGQIDVYVAHGTGTRFNDAMELRAIDSIFKAEGAKGPAITAVKGLIGHTLAASGLIEAALALEMLRRQEVPAIAGLQTPEEPGFDFVTVPRAMPIRHVLKVASGFGGINAAVILSAPGNGGPVQR